MNYHFLWVRTFQLNQYLYMRYLMSLVIAIFWMVPCSSQGTLGGEMRFFIHYQEIDARFMIYREGESKGSLVVDWGDSTIETLDWIESIVYPSVIIDIYNKKHTYSEPGSYAISFVDGPLISGVANIENSNEKYLNLVDTVVVYAPPHEYSFNEGIILDNNQLIFDVDDGVIKLPAIIGWGNGFPDYTEMVKVPYPAPGFTYPEATNGIYTNNQESPFYSELVWDRPVEPGIYALAFKMRELVPNIDTPDPNDTIMLSTYTRAMMVDVDSSMIVSIS
ncbi:MAG: hypothetical protein KDC34_19655, partial [Saprospiraceae bacterium]|nr:hypothetical protein [Saprospiraceae bacterium]